MVCIYLVGGNDSNNMIVPLDSPAYDAYARGRGALALAKDSLLGVQSGAAGSYGFHPNLPGLRGALNLHAGPEQSVGSTPARNPIFLGLYRGRYEAL